MNVFNNTDSQFPFSYIDFRRSQSVGCGQSFLRSPNLVQHSPQSTRVRHIKDLVGNAICVVETLESKKNNKYQLRFPPNNYNEAKLKNASCNYMYSAGLVPNGNFTARPHLDTILSLNYFTGLQNASFKDRSNFTLSRITKFDGWENQLKDLTESALEPLLRVKNVKRPQTTETRRELAGSMRRLYSSSGRILPTIVHQRPFTSPSTRPNTAISSSKSLHSENNPDEFDFDLQVFHILGGVLQTTDQEVIKTWLLTATERERALMVDLVRGALINKQELNIFARDPLEDESNLIIYTPNRNAKHKLTVIPEHNISGTVDSLQVHCDNPTNFDSPHYRPPTSSTFRSISRNSPSRPPTRQESTWMPSESIVVN